MQYTFRMPSMSQQLVGCPDSPCLIIKTHDTLFQMLFPQLTGAGRHGNVGVRALELVAQDHRREHEHVPTHLPATVEQIVLV